MSKHKRVIGTTAEVIEAAERRLGVRLPPSLGEWLLRHNGTGDILPVPDPRAPRTLADNLIDARARMRAYAADMGGATPDGLVPIMDVDGDYYCLDYTQGDAPEVPVVTFSHETLTTSPLAPGFSALLALLSDLSR